MPNDSFKDFGTAHGGHRQLSATRRQHLPCLKLARNVLALPYDLHRGYLDLDKPPKEDTQQCDANINLGQHDACSHDKLSIDSIISTNTPKSIKHIHPNDSTSTDPSSSPSPRSIELFIFVTCFRRLESGTLDYCLTFMPISFINTIRIPTLNSVRSTTKIASNHPLIMNILSWNVRGIGGANFKRVFCELISTHNPDIIILTKTRISDERANNIIASLGFERYFKVDAMEFSGGIWILWNPISVNMQPVSNSFQEVHLQCRVPIF